MKERTEGSPILSSLDDSPHKAVGFIGAIKIPVRILLEKNFYFSR